MEKKSLELDASSRPLRRVATSIRDRIVRNNLPLVYVNLRFVRSKEYEETNGTRTNLGQKVAYLCWEFDLQADTPPEPPDIASRIQHGARK